MLTGEETERGSGTGVPGADLLERHRAHWVAEVAGEQQALWLDDYMGEPADAALHAAAAEGRRDPRAADSLPRARQVHGAERRARLARLFEELWADRREQEISWTAPSG